MTKNKIGGSGHKRLARKNDVPTSTGKLRLATDNEVYCVVTKAYGNCRFSVKTIDEKELTMVIRGKFSGRNKRNNFVSVGSFVLVGLRTDETCQKTCDLLEIYSNVEVKRLSSQMGNKSKFFEQTLQDVSNNVDDELGGVFDYIEPPPQRVMTDMPTSGLNEEEEINIDDI
jgi:hypothetical protein